MTEAQPLSLGRLRDIQDSELALMLSWRNAPTVRANMYTRHEISLAEHMAWWARTRQRADQRYFIYERDLTPWGVVGFTGIDPVHANASWAFYASPEAARGTGSRMEYLALEHAFSSLGLHKITCEVLAFNTSVLRLHEKFGFKVEGIFREHHKVDGQWVDIQRLALFASQWADQRDQLVARLLASAGDNK